MHIKPSLSLGVLYHIRPLIATNGSPIPSASVTHRKQKPKKRRVFSGTKTNKNKNPATIIIAAFADMGGQRE